LVERKIMNLIKSLRDETARCLIKDIFINICILN
jgi:hypothetical protein